MNKAALCVAGKGYGEESEDKPSWRSVNETCSKVAVWVVLQEALRSVVVDSQRFHLSEPLSVQLVQLKHTSKRTPSGTCGGLRKKKKIRNENKNFKNYKKAVRQTGFYIIYLWGSVGIDGGILIICLRPLVAKVFRFL